MKILFFMSHGILARNFEWVLRELDSRGHRVHVALDVMSKTGISETNRVLEEVARECPRVTFGPAPPRKRAGIAVAGRGFRLALDYLRYLEPDYADAEKPRARLAARIPRALRIMGAPIVRSARGRAAARAILRLADEGVPVAAGLERFVREFEPDAILVTPLVDPGSPQTDYVRCAGQMGVPSVLAVHSWDNLTVKGGMYELPDLVAVWNDVQRSEAVRLHGVPEERVVVTGAVAYDHWFRWDAAHPRKEFCEAAGLDPARPFVLYLGSSRFIAPEESEFVREWNERIRTASPELADLQVLLRPHPLNPFVGAAPAGLVVATARDAEPFDRGSRASYFDAIHHAAAVVGILTSGMIEAAIVDRPVHTVLVDRYRDTQRETVHFRHLLPENGGMLIVGSSYREHAEQLLRSCSGESSARNGTFVASFIRPAGAASASSILADVVERLAAAPAARIERRLRPGATLLARAGWAVLRVFLVAHESKGKKNASSASESAREDALAAP